jgi:hypothetical protein
MSRDECQRWKVQHAGEISIYGTLEDNGRTDEPYLIPDSAVKKDWLANKIRRSSKFDIPSSGMFAETKVARLFHSRVRNDVKWLNTAGEAC